MPMWPGFIEGPPAPILSASHRLHLLKQIVEERAPGARFSILGGPLTRVVDPHVGSYLAARAWRQHVHVEGRAFPRVVLATTLDVDDIVASWTSGQDIRNQLFSCQRDCLLREGRSIDDSQKGRSNNKQESEPKLALLFLELLVDLFRAQINALHKQDTAEQIKREANGDRPWGDR
jgi:hypothetical protein